LIFAGTEFTTSGLLNSDTVTSVTLESTGTRAAESVVLSPYKIFVGNAVGTGLNNYTITYVPGELTVIKASPTFSNLSSPSITSGISTAKITGYIGDGTTPAAGDVVITITGHGVSLTTTVGLIGGDFTAAFTRNWAAGTYIVSYHYAGNGNFNAITPDASTVLNVE
jgi:large repetitive protein